MANKSYTIYEDLMFEEGYLSEPGTEAIKVDNI